MKDIVVFLSSTFRDLKFERRFIIDKLKEMGFVVISMEEHCKDSYNWFRWSLNQASKCDIYLKIFDKRVGSNGSPFFAGRIFKSITKVEELESRDLTFLSLSYKMDRPFDDYYIAIDSTEKNEYLSSLEIGDDFDFDQKQFESDLREGKAIKSFIELERALKEDLKISKSNFYFYRLKIWVRGYKNNGISSNRKVIEDEGHFKSTSRVGVWRRINKIFILLIISFLLASYYFLSPVNAIKLFLSTFVLSLILVIAYKPTYLWIGTKSIIARGVFASRVIRQNFDEPFLLKHHWFFLERITGIGAISIKFCSGQRVFVPLVHDPYGLVQDVLRKLNTKNKNE